MTPSDFPAADVQSAPSAAGNTAGSQVEVHVTIPLVESEWGEFANVAEFADWLLKEYGLTGILTEVHDGRVRLTMTWRGQSETAEGAL